MGTPEAHRRGECGIIGEGAGHILPPWRRGCPLEFRNGVLHSFKTTFYHCARRHGYSSSGDSIRRRDVCHRRRTKWSIRLAVLYHQRTSRISLQ